MKEPEFDADGYPTETTLEAIRKWPIPELGELLPFLKKAWRYADHTWKQESDGLHVSTLGWSGNESLIDAASDNFIFWTQYWKSSRRGGHYVFQHINEDK